MYDVWVSDLCVCVVCADNAAYELASCRVGSVMCIRDVSGGLQERDFRRTGWGEAPVQTVPYGKFNSTGDRCADEKNGPRCLSGKYSEGPAGGSGCLHQI